MTARVAVAVVSLVVVLAFAYFVPIIYVPAVSEGMCNVLCGFGGHAPYYTSISYRLIGQGAWYWPGHPQGIYELIDTPFGSFG
jgi:hypothetical protein